MSWDNPCAEALDCLERIMRGEAVEAWRRPAAGQSGDLIDWAERLRSEHDAALARAEKAEMDVRIRDGALKDQVQRTEAAETRTTAAERERNAALCRHVHVADAEDGPAAWKCLDCGARGWRPTFSDPDWP